jgi:hypothetical protein
MHIDAHCAVITGYLLLIFKFYYFDVANPNYTINSNKYLLQNQQTMSKNWQVRFQAFFNVSLAFSLICRDLLRLRSVLGVCKVVQNDSNVIMLKR